MLKPTLPEARPDVGLAYIVGTLHHDAGTVPCGNVYKSIAIAANHDATLHRSSLIRPKPTTSFTTAMCGGRAHRVLTGEHPREC